MRWYVMAIAWQLYIAVSSLMALQYDVEAEGDWWWHYKAWENA